MNTALLMTVLHSTLSGRRKRSGRAHRYLTGRGGLLSKPGALLAACGLAWGVYETLRRMRTPAGGSEVAREPDIAGVAPVSLSANGETAVPPLPDVEDRTADHAQALRLIRLAVSAAHADGTVNERERAAIMQQATASGLSQEAATSLVDPEPLASIVADVTSPEEAATLYVLAYTILRADEQVSPPERIYLAQLAHLLRLDAETAAALERDTGSRIDALGDQDQPGG